MTDDILRFVNSKDIREYLSEISYSFSSLEAAWLIYQCHEATIEEKHDAWRQVIKYMPDCEINRRGIHFDSLREFLNDYMDIEDNLINEFCDSAGSDINGNNRMHVYTFEYEYEDKTVEKIGGVFSSFEAIYENVLEPGDNPTKIICSKIQIDRLNSRRRIFLSPDMNIVKIEADDIENEYEYKVFNEAFDSMWFAFPTPFKKGDIVWDPRFPEDMLCAGPFILTGICNDRTNEKIYRQLTDNGDYVDMYARGYFQCDDGSIYEECMSNYMDLEYYNKTITGSRRTLVPLSNYIKGKIDLALCVKAYHKIMVDNYAYNSMPRDYMESGLALAGI